MDANFANVFVYRDHVVDQDVFGNIGQVVVRIAVVRQLSKCVQLISVAISNVHSVTKEIDLAAKLVDVFGY